MLLRRILFDNCKSKILCFTRSNFTLAPSRKLIIKFQNPNWNNRPDLNVPRCSFRTTAPRRNPVVAAIIRGILKVTTIMAARALRNRIQQIPPEQRQKLYYIILRNKRKLFALFGASVLGFMAYYQLHMEETPITQRKRFVTFTQEQFDFLNKIELEMQLKTHQKRLLPASHPTTKYVAKVAQNLIARNQDIDGISKFNWTVSVIDDPQNMNAFVLPGGNIFVFTGLLRFCDNEDQLAIVLAHELSHAILAHGIELASREHIVDLFFIIVLAFTWLFLPTDILALIGATISRFLIRIGMETPYSKMLESEADEVGLLLASKACFDVREASLFWEKMAVMEKANLKELAGTDEMPMLVQYLSTHPSHEERRKKLESLLLYAIRKREECGCPPLPSKDPRLNRDPRIIEAGLRRALTDFLRPIDIRSV